MKHRIISALLVAGLSFWACPSFAQEEGGDAAGEKFGQNWTQADTNKDGKISKEEYLERNQKISAERFAKIDKNEDDVIETAELEEYYKKRRRESLQRAIKQK